MRIDKLSLLNFRCFRQLDITFDENITILVAPNGAGKTTVLDAVRLALFPFIRGFDASLYVKDKSTSDPYRRLTSDLPPRGAEHGAFAPNNHYRYR
nr:ATP-binding protein [Salmonella sp. NCTC 7297]